MNLLKTFFISNFDLTSLHIVNLHGCKNDQDDGIIELSDASPNLRYSVVVF